MITQDESQQSLGGSAMAEKVDPMAMQTGRGQGFRGKKQFLQCEHYHMKCHIKENYFKIIGYPEDFRGKKRHQGRDYRPKGPFTAANTVEGPATTSNSQRTSQLKGGDFFFTEAQYQQIMHLLNKDAYNYNQTQANMAGNIVSLASNIYSDSWIVDSRATHHIASSLGLLNDVKSVDSYKIEKVRLPNGTNTDVIHICSTQLSANNKLENVLYVPYFKFNLISVSKLTMDLQCGVFFLPKLCVFQDLYSGRVKGIVKETGGLYLLRGRGT
nr:uncharacterized protein LOC117275503 [Nicotiana tomentosiformis]